jgi:hypothetical protein
MATAAASPIICGPPLASSICGLAIALLSPWAAFAQDDPAAVQTIDFSRDIETANNTAQDRPTTLSAAAPLDDDDDMFLRDRNTMLEGKISSPRIAPARTIRQASAALEASINAAYQSRKVTRVADALAQRGLLGRPQGSKNVRVVFATPNPKRTLTISLECLVNPLCAKR